MNIFVLDKDIKACAKFHCDKHVIKMILEYTQMLSTAVRFFLGKPGVILLLKNKKWEKINYKYVLPDENEKTIFLAGYVNHPCTRWVRRSKGNFQWLLSLTKELLNEYTYRYGKKHRTAEVIDRIEEFAIFIEFPETELSYHVLAMPEQYKTDDAVFSYRLFYVNEKKRFATWKKREKPEWYVLEDSVALYN